MRAKICDPCKNHAKLFEDLCEKCQIAMMTDLELIADFLDSMPEQDRKILKAMILDRD
jgi:hypothetical protein